MCIVSRAVTVEHQPDVVVGEETHAQDGGVLDGWRQSLTGELGDHAMGARADSGVKVQQVDVGRS